MQNHTIIRLLIAWIAIMSFFNVNAITVGETVENFNLPDYNGKVHNLNDYEANTVIVVMFLSTRCPVSNAYNERIAKLYSDYAGKKVAFLGINSNRRETVADIKTHASENGLAFPILSDEGNTIADQFGAKVTPEIYMLNSNLTVLYHGHIDDSQRKSQIKQTGLRDALDEVLANKSVTDASTKPFGCSIKRKR